MYSLDCIVGENEPDVATVSSMPKKRIIKNIPAEETFIEYISVSFTIKELRRKATNNECY